VSEDMGMIMLSVAGGGGTRKGVVWRSCGCVVAEIRMEIPVRGR